jgi:hypothetical protein
VLSRFLLLRLVLGLMCVVFAHFLGRSLTPKPQASRRGLGPASWALRTLLAGAAVTWRAGVDTLAAVVFALAVLSAAAGFYLETRPPKPPEDLTKQMFPDSE